MWVEYKAPKHQSDARCRGTLLIKNCHLPGPYGGHSGAAVSYERGTPVVSLSATLGALPATPGPLPDIAGPLAGMLGHLPDIPDSGVDFQVNIIQIF